MKATGMIRRVDEMGRIVLPAELRRAMDIGEKEMLEIYVEDDRLIMKKYRPTCVFCDSCKDILIFRGKNICGQCRGQLLAFEEQRRAETAESAGGRDVRRG